MRFRVASSRRTLGLSLGLRMGFRTLGSRCRGAWGSLSINRASLAEYGSSVLSRPSRNILKYLLCILAGDHRVV